MAHEIEGNYAFFTKKPAWHDVGSVLTTAPTIQEAWRLAYPFELFKLDLSASIKTNDGDATYLPIETHKAIIRSDGKQIGVVGDGYELLQPYEVFNSFAALLESGLVDLEAGGSLCEGRRMWALAKVKGSEAEVIKGDSVNSYVLMFTGFDGSLALGATRTSVRVVCANTLAAAMRGGIEYKIRHTKSLPQKLEEAKTQIHRNLADYRRDLEAYQYLATRKVTRTAQADYIGKVIGGDVNPKDLSTRAKNTIDEVVTLLDTQRGIDEVPHIQGTAWQAYNAISEYYTHIAGRSADSRVNSQWFGPAFAKNQEALKLALTL